VVHAPDWEGEGDGLPRFARNDGGGRVLVIDQTAGDMSVSLGGVTARWQKGNGCSPAQNPGRARQDAQATDTAVKYPDGLFDLARFRHRPP
jgi:hypothetical protein